MRKILFVLSAVFTGFSLYAQDYPHSPADKPETTYIEESQSREIRIKNLILPQEIAMQDKMRMLITEMMQDASKKLGWDMVELSEYTNNDALQSGSTPYALRSPRGIDITFQFIVNNDSLLAWKNYQTDYVNNNMNRLDANSNNMQTSMESPKYKQYRDSANYYMNLYTTYCEAHKDEGAALYTKDKHPKYYQQKETGFIDKANAMVQQIQTNSGIQQAEDKGKSDTRRFRNHTAVQVKFNINIYNVEVLSQISGITQFTSATYSISGSKISNLFSFPENREPDVFYKWNNVLMILLGNFQTKPCENSVYHAGFKLNGQGDEHTIKKIKSDKVQNISINIYGDKSNVEKMAKMIDVEKLNKEIVKY
ncbi:MAG: hypothetical protein ACRDE2_12095 [Chitinophagaceae bacterium]